MKRIAAPAVFAAVLAVAACSSKDKAPAPATATQAGAPAADPSAAVVVHGKDFAFDAPDSVPAGVTTFKFVNDGAGFHHMQIVRLDSGKTVADLQAAFQKPGAPPPMWMVMVGGPNAPNPQQESNATLDLAPGNYVLLCFVDIPGGVPHFAKGMMKALKVTSPARAATAAPSADINMTLKDYGFTLDKPITGGKHTFAVRDSAGQPHEVEIVKFAQGKTTKEFLDYMQQASGKTPPQGPPPASAVGGLAAIVPGITAHFSADFAPGDYALICFFPDAKDGKPHFAHGMIHTFTVN
jgi:hypothetical protein